MTHPYWFLLTAGIIALLPMLIGVTTSYLKLSIVLSMLRNGLGTQSVPSQMVLSSLALVLSIYVMGPVWQESIELYPKNISFNSKNIPQVTDIKNLAVMVKPWQNFMLKHSGERELEVFKQLEENSLSENALEKENVDNGISMRVVLPAFLVSELKEAFLMAFFLLLPFLVVDLIVSNILVGLGMFMLSPVLISLPLKLLLFVLSDGWLVLSKGLINSYNN